MRDSRFLRPVQGLASAFRTIERLQKGEIQNQLPVYDKVLPSDLVDFQEPLLLGPYVYTDGHNNWPNVWKLENIEAMFPDIYIKDLRFGRDIKRSVKEFRFHGSNMTNAEDTWFGKDIPIMHTPSCMSSKTYHNCMGCSSFWKSVQYIQEEIKPWGNYDLLHFEPEHTQTFYGHLAMNGSFIPQQREMIACDFINTLVK